MSRPPTPRHVRNSQLLMCASRSAMLTPHGGSALDVWAACRSGFLTKKAEGTLDITLQASNDSAWTPPSQTWRSGSMARAFRERIGRRGRYGCPPVGGSSHARVRGDCPLRRLPASDSTLLECSSQRAGHSYEQERSKARHHAISLRRRRKTGREAIGLVNERQAVTTKRAPTFQSTPYHQSSIHNHKSAICNLQSDAARSRQ